MNRLTLAVVQHNCRYPDHEKNTKTGLQYVKEAKTLGADIVLFPECFITAYAFPDIVETKLPAEEIEKHPDFLAWYEAALEDDSRYLKQFQEIAKELSIGIVITAFTKGKSHPQNSAYVIDKKGEVILKYSKVHTCDFSSERMLESGTEFKVCDFEGVRLGIMICYDREYPESARVLMMKGAEIILVPNDCTTMEPRLQVLSTRAYENMVAIAMANPPGDNAGCSCAYSPIIWDREGNAIENTIMRADAKTQGIFLADFEIDQIRAYRSREMMGNTFRKVNAYQELLNQEVKEPFIRTEII